MDILYGEKINEYYYRVRKNRRMSLLVIWIRYLIGFAFIPSGYTKLVGNRFTVLPVSNPVGFFFEAMYRTGSYWNFLGFVQLLAAFLLMTQRYATLGNFIFLPLITNIFLITYTMHFSGTVFITALMLFASVCLMLWDYRKWAAILYSDNFSSPVLSRVLPTYNRLWVITGFLLFAEGLLMAIIGGYLKSRTFAYIGIATILLTALVSLVLYFRKSSGYKANLKD